MAKSNGAPAKRTKTATKGAGFVRGHVAEHSVREALFFLVWSCPQPVLTAALAASRRRETAACRARAEIGARIAITTASRTHGAPASRFRPRRGPPPHQT